MFEIPSVRPDAEGESDSLRRTHGLPARFVVMCLCLAIGAATCSAAPKPKPDEGPKPERPIRPDDRSDRARFEEALAALEAGNFAEAESEFELIQAEQSSGSSTAELAELYVARASMGSLERPGSGRDQGSDARRREAVRRFAALRTDNSVDGRVRRAASLYWSLAQIRAGSRSRAASAMAEYPDALLGSAVLDRDRGRLWPVLVDGLHGNGRWKETLSAASGYYHWLVRQREEMGSESEGPSGARAATGSTPEGASKTGRRRSGGGRWAEAFDLARSRGFGAASEMSRSALEKRLDSDETFVRAAIGWAYLDRQLSAESLTEKQRRTIDERFREIAAELNAVGASGRVSELSVKLATLGGSKRLVLGAVLPLSGPNRSVGRRAVDGMLLAMRAFERRGPSRVTLVFQDSRGEPEATLSRLSEVGASAVVGPLDRRRAEKFAPVATRKQMPLLTLTAASLDPTGSERKPYVLRNFMNPIQEARAVATLAFHEYGDRRAAVAFPDVGYGRRVTEAFSREFRSLGGQVVATVSYDRKASNFSKAAGTIAEAAPDAVFIPDAASNVAEVTAFLAQEDVWGYGGGSAGSDRSRNYVHYLGTTLWYADILPRQAAEYVRGATIPTWYARPFRDDPTRKFGQRFRGVYDREPSNIEAFAYDNVRWMRRLMLERGLQDPTSVRDALLGGTEYRGATGAASFDESGRLRRRMRFVTVRNQRFRPLEIQVDITERSQQERDSRKSTPPSKLK